MNGNRLLEKCCWNLIKGILRISSGPVWIAQLLLFVVGGYIELVIIRALLQETVNATPALVGDRLSMRAVAIVSVGCAIVAVVHQFLSFRNVEVEHDLGRRKQFIAECETKKAEEQKTCALTAPYNSSQPRKTCVLKVIEAFLTFAAVFLLAAVTGEVPYLIALLLVNSGDSVQGLPRSLDFLDVFTGWQTSGVQGHQNPTAAEYQHRLALYFKSLFFSASILLATMFIVWDVFRALIGELGEKYSPRVQLPIWSIFFVSDVISVCVWGSFLWTLHTPSVPDSKTSAPFFVITGLTLLYAIVIIFRLLTKMFSQKTWQETRDSIV